MKSFLAGVLLAGSVLATTAPAHAVGVTADCGFETIAQETVTGGADTFTGAAYGYAVSDTPGSSIAVHCEVRVNGGTVASTDPGPSGQASVSVGQLTYTAADSDVVTLCAVYTGTESGEVCGATTTQQLPPQEIEDLLMALSGLIPADSVPAILCPIFASLSPGVPGVIDIAPSGDLTSAAMFWDCPPYGDGAFAGPGAAAGSLTCVEWWQYICHPWVHIAPCHEGLVPCGGAASTQGSAASTVAAVANVPQAMGLGHLARQPARAPSRL